jgi:superfamily II DNA or RNA helicase
MKAKLKRELSKRGLTELPYQVDLLTNPKYQTNDRLVFAAGTSAGKTLTTILWLELNQPKKALIIPASKTILRDNFEVEIEKFKPTFTYSIVTNKAELQKAISDKVQVIVALPQTLNKNYSLLPKLDMFILDEAHQWYFKSTIKSIVKHTKPKKQLLLTGSPSKFVADGNFTFKFVPVMELYDLGHVSNAKVEVVSSSYNFKQADWLSSYGNLKSTKTNSPKKAKEALEMVCDEMLTKLRSKTNGKYLRNWKGANKISKLFNQLDKTIIYTHSKKQANAFYKLLNDKMNGQVLLSHSESDSKSELFAQFQNDTNIKILVAVDRGRLGFNMPELFNIVDFTMTQSLDMLLQMYGRLLRKSNNNPEKAKIYFKVATKNTADYFVDLMTAMLCLTNMEWYSKYNGKNMGGIHIPKVLMSNKKRIKAHNPSQNAKSTGTKPYVSLVELGIPTDLNLFKQSALHSSDGLFDSIAWTTLDEVRREFFNITTKQPKINGWTLDEMIEEAKKHKGRNEFMLNGKGAYQWARKVGKLEEVCKHMKPFFTYWDIENIKTEAKKYKTKKEFRTNSIGAVIAAQRLGIYDDVCKHMEQNSIDWTKISDKQIISELKKYKSRNDANVKNRKLHSVAKRRNLIDTALPLKPGDRWYSRV